MAGLTQKRPALSDITNTDALDEDERKRLQRNARRVKRRAGMADEQRQETNRKQREYRARKKAESSYTPTAVQTPSSVAGGTTQLGAQTPFLTGVSTVVQVPSSQVNENLIPSSVAGGTT
ncbi:hypothetical protein PVAP13_5KG392507 [Panicum virgatum]|uniref:Uncharacterized protein n=1 Tax=Panicum virgatum TaxID=38727 RepID=A0A8T0SMT1_PANVG|nr:hypothetical protein PVAP13_5KG392507 [Panicum virgatum]